MSLNCFQHVFDSSILQDEIIIPHRPCRNQGLQSKGLMTLRTIKSEFTESLLRQMDQPVSYDFTIDGPIFNELHPRLIKAKLDLEHSPNLIPEYDPIFGWDYS